jgi:hypothetical protein
MTALLLASFFSSVTKKMAATEFTQHTLTVCNTLADVLFTKETLSQKHNHQYESWSHTCWCHHTRNTTDSTRTQHQSGEATRSLFETLSCAGAQLVAGLLLVQSTKLTHTLQKRDFYGISLLTVCTETYRIGVGTMMLAVRHVCWWT